MKTWIKAVLWSLFGIGVVFLLVSVRAVLDERVLPEPDIHIHVKGENAFLTENELLTRLRESGFLFVDQEIGTLKTEEMEQYIKAMAEVKSVAVYTHLNGTWNIDLELRQPIARVFNNLGESYYLDADGFTMKTSGTHTARVVVVTGDIPDPAGAISVGEIINNDSLKSIRKLDDVYRISNYVCNDPLMQSLIGQIHRERNGDFVLIPIVGGQRIVFGTALSVEEVDEKFNKLKIFYKEAIPYEGWNKYTEISLKYEDQIVCKKKE